MTHELIVKEHTATARKPDVIELYVPLTVEGGSISKKVFFGVLEVLWSQVTVDVDIEQVVAHMQDLERRIRPSAFQPETPAPFVSADRLGSWQDGHSRTETRYLNVGGRTDPEFRRILRAWQPDRGKDKYEWRVTVEGRANVQTRWSNAIVYSRLDAEAEAKYEELGTLAWWCASDYALTNLDETLHIRIGTAPDALEYVQVLSVMPARDEETAPFRVRLAGHDEPLYVDSSTLLFRKITD